MELKHKKIKNTGINFIKSIFRIIDYTLLTFSLIGVIYVGLIIYYLNNLQNCKCYKKNNDYLDIQFLIFIESLILILFLILAITSCINLSQLGGGDNKHSLFSILILILLLSINIYFIKCVYKIFQSIDEDCECTRNWIRYLLYFQTILIGFNSISLIVKLFTR